MLCRSGAGYSHVLLACMLVWVALYEAKKHMANACGQTFVPFYSMEIGNLSENRSEEAQPQHEMWILIENGNVVVQPPCQTFHSQIFIQKGNAVA